MNERDDMNLSPEESISDEISERVRSVLAAAEGAATAIRHEAEQQAQIKRRAAEAERQRYLEDAKAEAEALLEERMKRISEVSDSIIEGAESILMRMEGAQEAKRQLETMVHALAGAAEDLARASATASPPPRPRAVTLDDEPAPRMRAVPTPEEPDPSVVTELRTPQPPAEDAPLPDPMPDRRTEATEAAAPAADPVVEVVVVESEVEVVDAVEVVDEHKAEPEVERRPAEDRPAQAAPSAGAGNGAEEKEAHAPRGFDGDDMLAARLVALQMAVAGSARDEVEDHLRKTFALDEPGTILNDVFGTESKL